MTLSFGGGAGVLTIPGVISDGLTPGGMDVAGNVQAASASITGTVTAGSEVIAGALVAGDATSSPAPTFITLNGAININDVPGDQIEGWSPLNVNQGVGLAGDYNASALGIGRFGALNGHAYTQPVVSVDSISADTQHLQAWTVSGALKAAVGHAGGLGLFGATPPTVPRTLAQATITAITDANAKAAVQAVANALSDMGVLTLT